MATSNQLNLSLSGATGSGNWVGSSSPILTTPNIGAATATSINFGSTALSAYTVGTWTPTFTFNTVGNLSVSYSTRVGKYIVIGNVCVLLATLVFTPTFTTSAGVAFITSVPIPTATGPNIRSNIAVSGVTLPASATYVLGVMGAPSTQIQINTFGSGQASSALTTTNFPTGGTYTIFVNLTINV